MPLNVADAENAYLKANAMFKKWQARFLADWYEPQRNTVLLIMWNRIPPEVKAEMKRAKPEEYRQAEEYIAKIGGKNENS